MPPRTSSVAPESAVPDPSSEMRAAGLMQVASLIRLAMCGLIVWSGVPSVAWSQTSNLPPSLRVVTGLASPFVKLPGTPVSGFSIEVWQEVARRLGVGTNWTVLPDLSEAAQLSAVAEGRADVAISSLAIAPGAEAAVDFTVPYFEAGLQILVGTEEAGSLSALLSAVGSTAVLGLLGGGLALVLILAHALWLVERRSNPAFRRGYLRSVGEGVWGVLLIIATGEHGDRETPRVLKRVAVGGMWLLGVLMIAQFTATVTSALTVDQLRHSIQGPGDLAGRTIATAPGSVAAAWLTSQGLPFVPLTDTEQAYAMLVAGDIDAVVYGAPQLRHWLAGRGRSAASLVGPAFRTQRYAVAVGIDSPWRRRINEALLAMQADGTADEIEARWFRGR